MPPPRQSWGEPPLETSYGGFGNTDGYPEPYGGGNHKKKGSCSKILLVIIGGFITFGAISTGTAKNSGGEKEDTPTSIVEGANDSVPSADYFQGIQRIKLEDGVCIRSDQVLEDSLGWLSDTEEVEVAMEYFYNRTGIQPYLLICDGMDGKGGEITDAEAEDFLRERYESLYNDEGHMLFVFMEYEESEYITFLYTGIDAGRVMDEEAVDIFLTNADQYYTDSSLSDEAYFAKIFCDSADDIMGD